MVITRYKVKGPKLKVAVVADLHGKPTEELMEALKTEKPDVILCPGDLATVGEYDDRLVDPERREKRLKTQDGALLFLREAVKIAPTFASRGNHEWYDGDVYFDEVRKTGAVLLENEWMKFGDVWIGGQNSARCGAKYKDGKEITEKNRKPDIEWLKDSPDGYRLLLNHHPEYYDLVEPYADLILSGHTHAKPINSTNRVFIPSSLNKIPKGMNSKTLQSICLNWTSITLYDQNNSSCKCSPVVGFLNNKVSLKIKTIYAISKPTVIFFLLSFTTVSLSYCLSTLIY